MPRIRIICQGCGRKLSYLELAPSWTVRATCPTCHAVTVATLDAAGHVRQALATVPIDHERAHEHSAKRRLDGRPAS